MKEEIKKLLKELVATNDRKDEYAYWVNNKVITENNRIDVSHSEELDEDLQEVLGGINIYESMCFHNALSILKTLIVKAPELKVEVVLGMIGIGKTYCGHAWNTINGVNFDLTAEYLAADDFKYYPAAYFNQPASFSRQGVFTPTGNCENETFDVNGDCSVYVYFIDNL